MSYPNLVELIFALCGKVPLYTLCKHERQFFMIFYEVFVVTSQMSWFIVANVQVPKSVNSQIDSFAPSIIVLHSME
jgi:hypothetical protein